MNVESWDDGGEISHYSYLHTSEIFPVAVVKRRGAVRDLPVRLRPEIGNFIIDDDEGKHTSLQKFVEAGAIDSFLILHKGTVVFEAYPRMRPDDRHLLFSVTKAFVGTLVAQLEDRGLVDLEKPVEAYLPELKGSGWQGIRLRDVADMASGVEGTEESPGALTDPKHKHFQLEATLGWQPRKAPSMPAAVRSGDLMGLLKTYKRVSEPGRERVYLSANTAVLGEVVERVTGRRLADVISEEIWSRAGAEGDAQLIVNERGVPIAHAGLAMTLRDLARVGLLFTDAAKGKGTAVTSTMLRRLLHGGRPALLKGPHPAWEHHAIYQFDMMNEEGVLGKGGFAGQMLYVDTRLDVVVAYFATNVILDEPFPPLPIHKLTMTFFKK